MASGDRTEIAHRRHQVVTRLDAQGGLHHGADLDVSRAENLPWHNDYTLPIVMDSFRPDPSHHASYFFNWTSNKEASWARAYRRWLDFVNDYKNRGGIVSVGSDAGSLFTVWGFGTIREMELLEEAGFTPL